MNDLVIVKQNRYSQMRENAKFMFSEKQNFVNEEDFTIKYGYIPKYATLERKRWLLDGNYIVFPDKPENNIMGYMSVQLSQNAPTDTGYNESYLFETPIVITRTWETSQNSEELNIIFDQESYCNYLNVEYFDNEGNSLSNIDFYPDNSEYKCVNSVADFYSMQITFYGMNKSNRYLRVFDFEDGVLQKYSKYTKNKLLYVDFDAASYPVPLELPSSTLNIEIKSDVLQDFKLYDVIDLYIDSIFYMRYYVKKMSEKANNIYKIHAIDVLEYLDTINSDYKFAYHPTMIDYPSGERGVKKASYFIDIIQRETNINIIYDEELLNHNVNGVITNDISFLEILRIFSTLYNFSMNLIQIKGIELKKINDNYSENLELKDQFYNTKLITQNEVNEFEYFLYKLSPNFDENPPKLGYLVGSEPGGGKDMYVDEIFKAEYYINSIARIKQNQGSVNQVPNLSIERISLNEIRIYGYIKPYESVSTDIGISYFYPDFTIYVYPFDVSIELKKNSKELKGNNLIDTMTSKKLNLLVYEEIPQENSDKIFDYLNKKRVEFSKIYNSSQLGNVNLVKIGVKEIKCLVTNATCVWHGNKLKCEYEGLVIE